MPLERSLQFSRPVYGRSGTLCGRSKVFVFARVCSEAMIRPLLPCEMFSLQGMTLADVLWHEPDADDVAAESFTYGEIRSMVGQAFHMPSAAAAFLSAVLAIEA